MHRALPAPVYWRDRRLGRIQDEAQPPALLKDGLDPLAAGDQLPLAPCEHDVEAAPVLDAGRI
jgi:hypothetical protein